MSNEEIVLILNRLIESCRHGEEGFRHAAENIRNSEFRRLFNIFSQQRGQFAAELEVEIYRLGGEPFRRVASEEGVPPGDEGTTISRCQFAEEETVNNYREALGNDLPLDVQYVLKRQYMDIKDAFDRIRILQRAA